MRGNPIRRREFLLAPLLAAVLRAQEDTGPRASDVLSELQEGNRRFASSHATHPHSSPAWAARTSTAQHPHAAVLCCSDSRVAPEILFDQGIGDLFTVRVAGNVANEDEVASIEYALEHLHVPLCVVLGHSHCGAVQSVVENEVEPTEVRHLVQHIGEARDKTLRQNPRLRGQALVEAVVRTNVWESIEDMFRNGGMLREAARAGRFQVVGAVYNLNDGRVSWMGTHPQQQRLLRPR